MNNAHNITVIVICQSDLILAGFAELLKGCDANEVIALRRCDELIDYSTLTGHILVLTSTEEQKRSSSFVNQILASATGIQFLTISTETESQYSNQIINLYDPQSLIYYKINEVLNTFRSDTSKEADTELTRREIDVLQLVTKGYSNKEIADQLFVSTHTVISHRKNISEKTGIKSTSGLTMYAILKKIIDMNEIEASDLI
jgi:DNA-binding CsgD family transcriptional regulator